MLKRSVSIFAGILLSLFILYPTVTNGFLSDDFLDLDHRFSLRTFTQFEAGGFRPLTVAVWAFDAAVWNLSTPSGWHLTNFFIHFLNVFLVAFLLRRLGFSWEACFWGVLLFAVSWAMVPSAGRISGRTTMLATAPMLFSLIIHSMWLKKRKMGLLILSCSGLLASLLFKETMLLCAPLFGLAALDSGCYRNRKWTITLLQQTGIYLIPTLIYIVWRLAWIGSVVSYSDSFHFGFFMLKDLSTLAVMPFSPWLDSIPARLFLLASLTAFIVTTGIWRRKALIAGLLILPLITVLNLPPRADFAYAALPFAAVLISSIAERKQNSSSRIVFGLFILGCALSARDEVSRLLQAGDYTKTTINNINALDSRIEPGIPAFLSGVDWEVAGYGTLWPNMFGVAGETIGFSYDSEFHTADMFLEVAFLSFESEEEFNCVFARLGPDGFEPIRLSVSRDYFHATLPDLEIALDNQCWIEFSYELLQYSSLAVPGGGSDCKLLLSDAFNPCSLIVVEATSFNGDTAMFDLQRQESWLLGRGVLAIQSSNLIHKIFFTTDRLWLSEMLSRTAMKEEQLRK